MLNANQVFLEDVIREVVQDFSKARLCCRLLENDILLTHYHALLRTLFHQTRSSPYTFALAAANCNWRNAETKEYLLQHAEEERTHWRWILDDLRTTRYTGPSPTDEFPHPTCESYVSFNHRIATEFPVGRLAIAAVLEGIGAAFGSTYGSRLAKSLGLTNQQVSFFLSHGDTDKVHFRQLLEVIGRCKLEPAEWDVMFRYAKVAGELYRAMYDHEAYA